MDVNEYFVDECCLCLLADESTALADTNAARLQTFACQHKMHNYCYSEMLNQSEYSIFCPVCRADLLSPGKQNAAEIFTAAQLLDMIQGQINDEQHDLHQLENKLDENTQRQIQLSEEHQNLVQQAHAYQQAMHPNGNIDEYLATLNEGILNVEQIRDDVDELVEEIEGLLDDVREKTTIMRNVCNRTIEYNTIAHRIYAGQDVLDAFRTETMRFNGILTLCHNFEEASEVLLDAVQNNTQMFINVTVEQLQAIVTLVQDW